MKNIGVIGAGTMGIGIAQVAAQNWNQVVLIDTNQEVLDKAKAQLEKTLFKLVEKQKLTEADSSKIASLIEFTTNYDALKNADLVIEAIVENILVKHSVFSQIESIVSTSCILASNTSSLSIASISSVLKNPKRMLGIHFFNPAPQVLLKPY